MRLAVSCGKLDGLIKKTARDDNGMLTDERRAAVEMSLARVLRCLHRLALFAGVDLARVAEQNLEKILSRQARGVLRGSGDDR